MPSITDKFSAVLSGTTRPVATTLSAQKLVGATSASVQATTGWETSTPVHGIMYRVDASNVKVPGSQIDWKAIVVGTTLTNFTVTAGTDDTYEVGTVVELSPTAAWGDDLVNGILVSLDQDGTLKAGAVDNAAALASDVVTTAKILDSNVTTAKIADAAVTPAKLLAGTGTSWPTTDYSGSATVTGWSSTTAKQIRYKQVGKNIIMYLYITGTSNSTSLSVTLPVTPSTNMTYYEGQSGLVVDNTTVTGPGRWSIDNSSGTATTVQFFTNQAGGSWTASGNKTLRATVLYEAA